MEDYGYSPNEKRARKKYFMPLLLSGVFVIVLFFGFKVYIDSVAQSSLSDSNEEVEILIRPGESVDQITQQLLDNELIDNKYIFWLYLRWYDKARDIKAGKHFIARNNSIEEIIDILSTAEARQISLTIPEGFTISQVDSLVAEKGLLKAGEIVECAKKCDFSEYDFLPAGEQNIEGLLFPDTYYVDPTDFSANDFLNRLIGTFDEKTEEVQKLAQEQGKDFYDLVIMASLIEEETRKADERPVVSGILWKRLDVGMHLGVDATVRYALNDWDSALTYEELQIDSPYNTRQKLGLPPGPIANPGLSSLNAAANPEDSPYFYYLHDSEGQIHYATSLSGHNVNKQKYIY